MNIPDYLCKDLCDAVQNIVFILAEVQEIEQAIRHGLRMHENARNTASSKATVHVVLADRIEVAGGVDGTF